MDENTRPRSGEKTKRYQGYDVNRVMAQNSRHKKPWFWKILGLSLILTFLIIGIICAVALRRRKQQTNYLSKINESNTLDTILEDHSNATVTLAYTGLKDGNDHSTIRFLKKSKKGTLFSYLKTEGFEQDYKEVLTGEKLYRFDGNFTYFYGLVGDDFDRLMADIEAEVFQVDGSESVKDQTESSNLMKATLEYEVQAGDPYTKLYGFQTGTVIQKVLTIEKDSLIVTSDVETANDQEIYHYTVTFDGDNKNPKFYRAVKEMKTSRKCAVTYNVGEDDEEKYEYTFPQDIYFTLLDHDDYKVYMDENCTIEFTNTQMQLQNPESDMDLYMKKGE